MIVVKRSALRSTAVMIKHSPMYNKVFSYIILNFFKLIIGAGILDICEQRPFCQIIFTQTCF